MAEPLILAYGRGELPEFPASPDAVLDIVPCDHVVNAILAVCATDPEIGEPRFYHVNSGARNPLTFRDCTATSATTSPSTRWRRTPRRGPVCRSGSSRARRRSSGCSRPRSGRTGWRSGRWPVAPRSNTHPQDRQGPGPRPRIRLDFLRRYHSLYNEYAQSELHFVDDNTLALTSALDPRGPAELRVRHRGLSTGRPTSRTCTARRSPRRCGGWTRCAASAARRPTHDEGPEPGHRRGRGAGDLRPRRHDHVHQRDRAVPLGPAARAVRRRGQVAEVGQVLRRLPSYLRAEQRDRGSSCARSTAGTAAPTWPRWRTSSTRRWPRTSSAGCRPRRVRRIREHRAAGHTTILITGVVRPLTRPLRRCST